MVEAVLMLTELLVLLHPDDKEVYVKVALPTETPVITPASVTVAMPELLLVQVTPDEGVRFPVLPTQTVEGLVIVGDALTVRLVDIPEIDDVQLTPEERVVIVITVVPELANEVPGIVKLPAPAVVTFMVAVSPEAVLGEPRL